MLLSSSSTIFQTSELNRKKFTNWLLITVNQAFSTKRIRSINFFFSDDIFLTRWTTFNTLKCKWVSRDEGHGFCKQTSLISARSKHLKSHRDYLQLQTHSRRNWFSHLFHNPRSHLYKLHPPEILSRKSSDSLELRLQKSQHPTT